MNKAFSHQHFGYIRMKNLCRLNSNRKMMNWFKSVFTNNNTKTGGISLYQGADYSFDDIKQELSLFAGGNIEVKLDDDTGIGIVCINHPEKKNAISGKMMVDLEAVVSELEQWETGKGVIIYGAKENFCSGGDLHFAQETGTAEGGYKMSKFMQNALLRLQRLPIISVAFIEGFALGGGAELAISCDFRLFSEGAAMGFVHSRMGLIPAWGGLTTAVRMLGYRTALDLVTTARVVRADDAKQIGLCDEVVADMTAATEWLAKRTRAEASVVRAAKCVAVNSKMAADTEELVEFEKRSFAPLWGGPAQKLALSQKIKHNKS